ncbi:hypothetical protein D6C89_08067 [Aureobasidium pullulans]|nr:hypothetical protein D6C89_08067 [Aureobasidium pullulans]
MLLQRGDWQGSPLAMAAIRGRKTHHILELLLKHEVDVNRACEGLVFPHSDGLDGMMGEGLTALHMCAASDSSCGDNISLLVSYGADLEAKSSDGSTPLALAVQHGRLTTTTVLLAEGADTSGPSRLTKKDKWYGTYEGDFQAALRLVRKTHNQRTALKGNGS